MTRPNLTNPVLYLLLLAATSLLTTATVAQSQTAKRGVEVEAASEIKQWPGQAKRFALIIGVDKYDDPQINSLNGAANDARVLRDALVEHAGFPAEQVALLASDQPVERQPKRDVILKWLAKWRTQVPKDGLLLVAFSGHGIERNGQAYLLPADATSNRDITLLEDTALSVERLKSYIRAIKVGQVMLILDACRNDPVAGRSESDNKLTSAYAKAFNFDQRNREVEAFVTLYATAVGQRAYEYSEKRQGYFTWAFVEALKGKAANERNEVTLSSLVQYLQTSVPKYVARDLGTEREQRPFAVVEGYKADELVIAVSAAPQTTAATNKAAFNNADTVALSRGKADTYLEQGLASAKAKQYAESVALIQQAFAQSPNWSNERKAIAYYILAYSLDRLGQDKEAEEAVSTGLQLDAQNAHLRQLHAAREDRQNALQHLQSAIAHFKAARYNEAAHAAQAAIALKPVWAAPMIGATYALLARAQLELGRKAEALEAINQALTAEPENQDYRDFQSRLLTLTNNATPSATLSGDAKKRFQHYDLTENGWLNGKELDNCACRHLDKNGDGAVSEAEFLADATQPAQNSKSAAAKGNR